MPRAKCVSPMKNCQCQQFIFYTWFACSPRYSSVNNFNQPPNIFWTQLSLVIARKLHRKIYSQHTTSSYCLFSSPRTQEDGRKLQKLQRVKTPTLPPIFSTWNFGSVIHVIWVIATCNTSTRNFPTSWDYFLQRVSHLDQATFSLVGKWPPHVCS